MAEKGEQDLNNSSQDSSHKSKMTETEPLREEVEFHVL